MSTALFALSTGLAFGLLDVLAMTKMQLPDRRRAMTGAFLSRFAIGFLIPWIHAPIPGWAIGATVGLLVSLPDAVITKKFVPIVLGGVVGGTLIGIASTRWVA
ncbi:MAG: hypothetical protein U1E76_19240 [Planctomycetota bacterium]